LAKFDDEMWELIKLNLPDLVSASV
jgi:hypothetical protein